MQTRFLLGPAGSGKTFRCLAEIRAALQQSPEGAPLILIAPKQATFQLERQLLADDALPGYARLRIFSFERLADFVLDQLHVPQGRTLSEEGRVMVLRALLSQNRARLKIFRSSARLPGFARQLSLLLRELQRHQLAPAALFKLSENVETHLGFKLHDLALLLEAYVDWLKNHKLQDANRLLDLAADALQQERRENSRNSAIHCAGLWLDGFAEMTPQEIHFLAALAPHCDAATLAFCLDPGETEPSALSIWSVVNKTYRNCRARLEAIPGVAVNVEELARDVASTRFAQGSVLRHLEKHWTKPEAFRGAGEISDSLRLTTCANPEAEATLAAQEILRFVRAGGRFRDAAVLLRQFDGYHDVLRRVFARYEIPFFLDRRESAAHHPLAELTRSALRLATFDWEHDDWFCILKTGLVTNDSGAVDELENESLARGWRKSAWLHPLQFGGNESPPRLERLRQRAVPPFQKLSENIVARKFSLNGIELAEAIQTLWRDLKIEEQLSRWGESHPVHETVWNQMQDWLENIALAFSDESNRLNEWLPILESGLGGLTVGAIPPAMDQVLIGTVDRSRNPDLRLALVLGLNETIFPAPPRFGNLLTESDHATLAGRNVLLGPNKLELLGRERFYGYIACTRARERLVLSCASQDNAGRALNPSAFFGGLKQLFPSATVEKFSGKSEWFAAEHWSELMPALIQTQTSGASNKMFTRLAELPCFDSARGSLENFSSDTKDDRLSPETVEKLYGKTLQSSVSALEQFAACPFRFFVSTGLRGEERKLFELDVRERGSFQHAVLARFHEELREEQKRWRDISPAKARERVGRIAAELKDSFNDGLLGGGAANEFAARSMAESLQNFIETIVGWMSQYDFDPHAVELSFGTKENALPAWELDLGEERKLVFRGIIDRVDIFPLPGGEEALAVVIDYKSSVRQLDALLFENGLQLQLPAYLALLRQLSDPKDIFGVKRLVPAGVFYVNLRGKFSTGKTREDVLEDAEQARATAYRHSGRFDFTALPHLDNRSERTGTQFSYRLKNDGAPYANSHEIMRPEEFGNMLAEVEQHLVRIGREIFSGNAAVDPYQKGGERACDYCDYRAICRIDPWSHGYRVLKKLSPTHSLAR